MWKICGIKASWITIRRVCDSYSHLCKTRPGEFWTDEGRRSVFFWWDLDHSKQIAPKTWSHLKLLPALWTFCLPPLVVKVITLIQHWKVSADAGLRAQMTSSVWGPLAKTISDMVTIYLSIYQRTNLNPSKALILTASHQRATEHLCLLLSLWFRTAHSMLSMFAFRLHWPLFKMFSPLNEILVILEK